MRIEEVDYFLPKEMIAQYPCEDRTGSRLLVFDRKSGVIEHRHFRNIVEYLREGDLLVLNDSKVFPAKLTGRKETGGKVELLLVEQKSAASWSCLTNDVKRKIDSIELLVGNHRAVLSQDGASWLIRFMYSGDSREIVMEEGRMPLPPYIKRTNGDGVADFERYQTVYAENSGSIAAPTAGFHFSEALMEALSKMGVEIIKITLHIGTGTFSLVKTDDVEGHTMHHESYGMTPEAKSSIAGAKETGRRIVACGTSAVRTLETVFSGDGDSPLRGSTGLFIYPGFTFKVVDAVITNFHLPRSTPLLLAAAFAGKDALLMCYREAIERNYRFYSYGDSMMIL